MYRGNQHSGGGEGELIETACLVSSDEHALVAFCVQHIMLASMVVRLLRSTCIKQGTGRSLYIRHAISAGVFSLS
jgi:hypothetical protein